MVFYHSEPLVNKIFGKNISKTIEIDWNKSWEMKVSFKKIENSSLNRIFSLKSNNNGSYIELIDNSKIVINDGVTSVIDNVHTYNQNNILLKEVQYFDVNII